MSQNYSIRILFPYSYFSIYTFHYRESLGGSTSQLSKVSTQQWRLLKNIQDDVGANSESSGDDGLSIKVLIGEEEDE